jgi:glycosyltransferase involved in cell wall biosynthesis
MRILIVNWARIEDGASSGGGVNGYCQGVALEMIRRGHEVASLSSGTSFEHGGAGTVGPCRIRERGHWRGVALFDIVNSPVLAPSLAQFRGPLAEVASPDLESVFAAWIRGFRPDIAHFHNIEGLSAGCVPAAHQAGARVVYSLHNYHTLCPQVYLMQGHRRPCWSFDNGHACVGCVPARDPAEERARRADGTVLPPTTTNSAGYLPPPPWETIHLPAWKPLANDPSSEPISSREPNEYARRRAAMVAMLNSCDRVLAVSEFVRRKFLAMGVENVRTLHIGCRLSEQTGSPRREPSHADPVRLAFIGYNTWYKGLPMLTDSLELLVPEFLSRIHLTVLALNLGTVLPQLRRLEPRLAGLRIAEGYRNEQLPTELAGIDLGVVPSVWWDNGPQTVMEFHACGIPVLGAELGGIPDFVRDGVDGLLFRGNDRWDLARRLAQVIRKPEVLAVLRSGVRPPKTMAEHGTELEREYQSRLS